MTFFTVTDLVQLDSVRIAASPDTAVITRQTGTTSDGHGGAVENWTTVATVAACVADIGRLPEEMQIAGQLQGETTVEITVPSGTDVDNNDRIIIGANDVQTLSQVGTISAGTFSLIVAGGTALIPWNSTAAIIASSTEALATVGSGNVAVTGGSLPVTPVVLTFTGGTLLGQDVSLSIDNSGLTGGSIVATHTQHGHTDQVYEAAGVRPHRSFEVRRRVVCRAIS